MELKSTRCLLSLFKHFVLNPRQSFKLESRHMIVHNAVACIAAIQNRVQLSWWRHGMKTISAVFTFSWEYIIRRLIQRPIKSDFSRIFVISMNRWIGFWIKVKRSISRGCHWADVTSLNQCSEGRWYCPKSYSKSHEIWWYVIRSSWINSTYLPVFFKGYSLTLDEACYFFCTSEVTLQGPILRTWINFNPSMDKSSHNQ